MCLVKIRVHRLWVLSRRPTNQLSHSLPISDLHKLIDGYVGFELAFNLKEVIERDTDKFVYGRVRVFDIQRVYLALQIVVICPRAVVVFYQPDNGFVIFHVVGQVDTDTADRVMYDAIYEERDVGH